MFPDDTFAGFATELEPSLDAPKSSPVDASYRLPFSMITFRLVPTYFLSRLSYVISILLILNRLGSDCKLITLITKVKRTINGIS